MGSWKRWWGLVGMVCLIAARPAAAADLVMAVSEGSSGGLDHARVIAKYKGLANAIGKSIGTGVNVVFIREFSALEDGLKSQRFDLAMARPSDYPARAMRDYGYQFVATSKPEGKCLIVTTKDSPLKSVKDLQDQRVVLPNPVAYMTKFCAAELRDQGIVLNDKTIVRVKEQDAIPFMLTTKFGEVAGVASYSGVARKLDASGLRVLHESRTQPYFPLVAKKSLTSAQVQAIQKALLALNENADGKEVLKTVGIEGFDTGTQKPLGELLGWLGL